MEENKNIVNSIDELSDFLRSLPDETERAFEKEITILCTRKNQNKNLFAWARELASADFKTEEDEKIGFAAFCVLANIARRGFDRTKEKDLIYDYSEKFQTHKFFNHLKLLCMLDNKTDHRPTDILNLAYNNSNLMKENAGIQHALADAVATLFEDSEFNPEQKPEEFWLERGMNAVDEAIRIENTYAKFYCTRARLLSLMKDHRTALENIDLAIDYEDSRGNDYSLRVGKYQMYAQAINNRLHNDIMIEQFQKEMAEQREQINNELIIQRDASIEDMTERQKKLEEQTNRSRIKNMEFIGLFAGIISFTIGGLNIAEGLAGHSISAVAGLIIVLMGALLGVYAGFGVILHGFSGKESVRNYIVFAMGLLLIAGGVFLCFV